MVNRASYSSKPPIVKAHYCFNRVVKWAELRVANVRGLTFKNLRKQRDTLTEPYVDRYSKVKLLLVEW